LLRTSPDAKKKDDDEQSLPIPYESPKDTEKQIISNPLENDSHQPSSYYFSTTGTPLQQNFSTTSFNSILIPQPEKDLNKIIDARINQKLWNFEQTLNHHYLAGFRLRNYDVGLKQFGYDDVEILTSSTTPDHLSPSPESQFFQKNDEIPNPLNSGEQRPQYPNVTIGQSPFEKKRKGGSKTFSTIEISEITNISTPVTDGENNISNAPVSTSTPSSSYSNLAKDSSISGSDNKSSNPITLSQSQTSLPPPPPSPPIQQQE